MNEIGSMHKRSVRGTFCCLGSHDIDRNPTEVAGMDQFLSLRNDCNSLVYCTDFGLIEEKLQQFDEQHRGEDNEYSND